VPGTTKNVVNPEICKTWYDALI